MKKLFLFFAILGVLHFATACGGGSEADKATETEETSDAESEETEETPQEADEPEPTGNDESIEDDATPVDTTLNESPAETPEEE
ncbi:MAG: hypothetical protein OHK0053_11340 [Microscillaceae bacterium]